MEHVWKYLTALVLIEIATLIYLLLTISNDQINPSEFENNEVKERKQSDVGTLSRNNTNINPTFERNGRASTGLVHLKKSRSIKLKKAYHLPKTTVSLNTTQLYKTTKRDLNAKYLPFTRAEKRMQNNLHDFNIANKKIFSVNLNHTKVHSNDLPTKYRETCNISFDSESLIRAREKLSKPYYLFRVKLEIDEFQIFPNESWDALLHWQYVLKQEKILVQLPVDFDLITFTLLYIDKEETKLDIKVMYNNHSKCLQDDFSKALQYIRFLLWNELFFNDTKYYLCNRYYEKSCWRTFQYFLTTIWVGYDLTCSEMSSRHGLYEFQVQKDLPGTSIICFLLSLQFVWIFALLDIKNRNINVSPISSSKTWTSDSATQTSTTDLATQTSTSDIATQKSTSDIATQTSTSDIATQTCILELATQASTSDLADQTSTLEATFSFYKNDRPYGPKRFFLKLFSCTCCCCCTNPTKRLIFLMWIFIFFPFGIIRTMLRPIFNDMSTVGPSEPILSKIPPSYAVTIVILDSLYAILPPLFYICLGDTFLRKFSEDNLQICSCLPEDDKDSSLMKNKKISDRFTFRCYQFCKTLCVYKNNCKDCNSCRNACSNSSDIFKNCCNCFCFFIRNVCRCIGGFIYCLFPIIPFNYYDVYSNCNSCNDSFRCDENSYDESGNCWCSESNCCTCKCMVGVCKQILKFFLNSLCFILSYFLCLRPMISTFTFLFRSFTYFVFVALPIRAHIMRIMLIFVTTFFYFLRYFYEIINMNADILNYIFKLEKEQKHSKVVDTSKADKKEKHANSIDEKMFDYIYDNLMFVKKSYYFLSLKMIVVIMYLIITMETYLTNTQSLTGTNFKDMMEFMLIIIGPYAISVFLKANKDDFLTEENKSEIKTAYNAYKGYHKGCSESYGTFQNSQEIELRDVNKCMVHNENSPLLGNTLPKM